MERSMTYEAGLNLKATELRLGLPGTDDEPDQKQTSAVSSSLRRNKRPSSDFDNGTDSEKSDHNSSPTTKVQVVGWPPVRSYMKNIFQTKNTDSDACAMYVKVSMDGAPYLRKIDLKLYKSYPELLKVIEHMFKCTIGVYSERERYNRSDYEPTYEDKDGDWMLVGDVPWHMFVTSCRRLRIMKGSEAKGLGCL